MTHEEFKQLKVGPYIFVQAAKVLLKGNHTEIVPVPDTYAIPGGGFASTDAIKAWAKDQCYSFFKEK